MGGFLEGWRLGVRGGKGKEWRLVVCGGWGRQRRVERERAVLRYVVLGMKSRLGEYHIDWESGDTVEDLCIGWLAVDGGINGRR